MILAALGTIFGWAFFSFWSAIPAGMALGVSPALVALTVTLSYASGAALVAFGGAAIRERLRRRLGDTLTPAEPGRMLRLLQQAWLRFGLVGLGLLAPMTVGAQAGALIGLGFGAAPWPLVIALTLGAGAWSIGLTLAVLAGVMAVSP